MDSQKSAVNGAATAATNGVMSIGNAPDRQALRAARSLHVNRRHQAIIEDRIARATTVLRSCLAGTGQERVQLGIYLVEVVDGEIRITQQPLCGSTQLVLWRPEGQMDLAASGTDDRSQASAAG